ncbi:MAG TPA: SDR family NAD(P)-dependent oxidoreductase [Anaerolineales bacterium]|nr:SDR family NAD(P)-dependent oxidoreductase [Anaerolineales bacterium]
MELENKVALITGAGRGIGRALAFGLARARARVAVNDIDPATARDTASALLTAGHVSEAFPADVADPSGIGALMQGILSRWGRLDILINNAGVEPHSTLLDLPLSDWQRTLEVNLTGSFLASQAAGRVMKEQGGGVIVNIASIAGRASGLRNRAAYVASKTGLIGLTRECAREFAAYNIRVNAVCPGVIVTEMTSHLRQNEQMMKKWLEDIPQARLGEPEDVVGLVLFLCTDAARYITGQAINVDGGKVMC